MLNLQQLHDKTVERVFELEQDGKYQEARAYLLTFIQLRNEVMEVQKQCLFIMKMFETLRKDLESLTTDIDTSKHTSQISE